MRTLRLPILSAALCMLALLSNVSAQVSVTTYHNDNARTGQNTQETILTTSNVNSTSFGKLFTTVLDGSVYSQPLYVANVSINGGVHNVLYVTTEHDSLYALDADSGAILWQLSLIASGGTSVNSSSDTGCGDLVPEIGITGTPVIDPSTATIYVVAKSKVGGSFVQYLHALDIVTHAEKFGGPKLITATVNGTGDGSSGGKLNFDPLREAQRPGLLLLNGHVIIGWASHCDIGPYHGWVMSYAASTLAQEAVWNTTPNGGLGGIWMSGEGLAADASSNIYFATGNGSYDGSTAFSDSIVKLGLPSGGTFPVVDWFTPYNQSSLSGGDTDVGSGGLIVLPDLPAGSAHIHLLVQMGKEGKMYLVNRDGMGKFCSTCTSVDTNIVQELPGVSKGIWGTPAYWNGNVYWGGGDDNGNAEAIQAFSLNANNSGLLSTTPTSITAKTFNFSGPVPSISSNGTSNGILWGMDDGATGQALYAYDATNLTKMLYNSTQAASNRDYPGASIKFATPTIANGKVYVGSKGQVSGYGLLSGGTQTAATPTFTPAPGTYTSAQSVTLADSTAGAKIYYTTDNSTPTTSSNLYSTAISVPSTVTIKAIAAATGFTNSAVASGTYTINISTQTATPTFTPAPGTYSSAQSVQLSDATTGAKIYYTTDNSTPSTSSALYSAAIPVSSTTTIKAIAAATGFTNSGVASGVYTITAGGGGVNYGSGFSATGLTLNGTSTINGTRLRLTDAVANEAGSAFATTAVNVQTFTNDFSFQLTTPSADGFTFTIQGNGPTAIGPSGGGLGYGPDSTAGVLGIGKSVAVKFDIYSNSTEGTDSTGLYTNGASPTLPAVDMTPSGVNLLSGHLFNVHMTYDGTTLTMTITDAGTPAQTFTQSWAVNIPSIVGGNTAYVGFTGGTGGQTAVQEIATWTYSTGGGTAPTAATPAFTPAPGTFTTAQSVTLGDSTTGAVIHYTTDLSTPTASSAVFSTAIPVGSTTTIKAIAIATGYNNSAVASGTYTINLPTPAATPTFSPAPGTYTSAQSVQLGDTTTGAKIYYTLDGSNPTTSSTLYSSALAISSTTTIKAIAAATGFTNSAIASGVYTINSGSPSVNFGTGFTSAGLALNGTALLNGTRLRLTDSANTAYQAGSAYYSTPVNVQSFTTDFSLQLTNPNADGMTFVIQGQGPTAIGPIGGGLGYGSDTVGGAGGIPASVAVKFDLYDNAGEGINSTGLYTNGASPTTPATTLGGNVNLHSGDLFNVHITYDGTTLTMKITDAGIPADTFTTSWAVNIPSVVGANIAYVGFTGGTGGQNATQEIVTWTYTGGTGTGTKTPIQYETENLTAVSSGPTERVFAWTGFKNGMGTILDATKVGDNVTFTVNVAAAGTYDVKIATKKFNTRGIFQLAVNGANVGATQDEYSATEAWAEYDLGNFSFATAGNYSFKLTVTGKNTSSSGYSIAYDYIKLTPQ